MKSKTLYTRSEAHEIISLIKEKLKADSTKQKGIRDRIRKLGFYASEFGLRNGFTVENFLSVIKIAGDNASIIKESVQRDTVTQIAQIQNNIISIYKKQSDESYVIDLCDEVLRLKAIRQHRFDFLKGDAGTKLPVDAWYPTLNMVVEFREKQHTEEVKFFDRRQTVSGIGRGEQRKLYDQRRRDVLPQNGIKLIEIGYDAFEYDRNKKLVRNKEKDLEVINHFLKHIVK